MAFWIGILVAIAFVLLAVKQGFHETWVMLFNIIVAVYLALFLRPMIANIIPEGCETPYNNALIMFFVAAATFAVLHGIAFIFFTGQFNVSFPKILNIFGSGLLGFCIGFLVWSFFCLLMSVTPISKNKMLDEFGFGPGFQQSNTANVKWWVDKMNNLVSSKSNYMSTDQVISELMKTVQKKDVQKSVPVQTADPNMVKEPNSVDSCAQMEGHLTSPKNTDNIYQVSPKKQ